MPAMRDHVQAYVERPEKWFVYVPTRCSQLSAEGRCSIWGRHPVLCREAAAWAWDRHRQALAALEQPDPPDDAA